MNKLENVKSAGRVALPAIVKTEGEKIRLAKTFLDNRGFTVSKNLVDMEFIASYLNCSIGNIRNLRNDDDFTKPLNIGSERLTIKSRPAPRWRMSDIDDWLELRKK